MRSEFEKTAINWVRPLLRRGLKLPTTRQSLPAVSGGLLRSTSRCQLLVVSRVPPESKGIIQGFQKSTEARSSTLLLKANNDIDSDSRSQTTAGLYKCVLER
jgi:hypothetical protein